MRRQTKRVLKGTLAGLAGGLAGVAVMTQFQKLWSKTLGAPGGGSGEPAAVKAARTIFHVSENKKNMAGNLMHYAFGTANGAAYGALAEVSPVARACAGTLFGATLFLVADEFLIPVLKLSKPPTRYPPSTHIYGLASHLVYGLTTDGVRRIMRHAM